LVGLFFGEMDILKEIFSVIKEVATKMNEEFGAYTVFTNVGQYQSTKLCSGTYTMVIELGIKNK